MKPNEYAAVHASFKDDTVEDLAGAGFRLHIFHPQWGGYGGIAFVEFDRSGNAGDPTPGCFELTNFHDGEFGIDPAQDPGRKPFEVHCCDARQFVDFGLTILEAQVKHQKTDTGEPMRADPDWCRKMAERLLKLAGEPT